MPSRSEWMWAKSPNHKNSLDKKYPYSEVPYIGTYKLNKIPEPGLLVDLVDYWGEGRIQADQGISGYVDCYNVNHEYQTVSNGPDRGSKIPNRIPVISYTKCDTSAYIHDDRVAIVTLMGAPINKSCAADIARMINGVFGRVIIFGFDASSADVTNLELALVSKHLSHCPGYELSNDFKSVTLFSTYRAYLNRRDLEQQLYYNISSAAYPNAVALTQSLVRSDNATVVTKVVDDCLNDGLKELMNYAYALWDSGEFDAVSDNFPQIFKLIFGSKLVKIINGVYNLPLKLDVNVDYYGDRKVWGDGAKVEQERLRWAFTPISKNGKLYFKIKNIDEGMVLKLDVNTDSKGNRPAWGAPLETPEHRTLFKLKLKREDDELVIYIKNSEFGQPLVLAGNKDEYNDIQMWGDGNSSLGQPWKLEEYKVGLHVSKCEDPEKCKEEKAEPTTESLSETTPQ